MDHSSALKKTKQQLQESKLGINSISLDLKNSAKPNKQVKKVVQEVIKPATDSIALSVRELKKKQKGDVTSLEKEIESLKSNISDIKKDAKLKISKLEDELAKVNTNLNNSKKEEEKKLSTVSDKISTEVTKTNTSVKTLEQQVVALKKEVTVQNNAVVQTKSATDDSISKFSKSYDSKLAEQNKKLNDQVKQLNDQNNYLSDHNKKLNEQSKKMSEQAKQLEDQSKMIKDLQATLKELTKMVTNNTIRAAEASESVSSNVKTLHVGDDFNLPEQPDVVKEGGLHKVAPLSLTVNGAVLFHDIGYTTDKKGLVPLFYDPVTNRVLFYKGK